MWRSLSWDTVTQKPLALVDTNAINDSVDGKLDSSKFAEFQSYITTIQFDELAQTPDGLRRRLLFEVVKTVGLELIRTGVFIPGYSQFSHSNMGMKAYYNLVFQGLESCQRAAIAKRKHQSNIRDAILAETTIVERMVLISNDGVAGQ